MMEIKVQCHCGQRFKFDVEPVNWKMPFVINCPICGADGTPKANEILSQLAATHAAESEQSQAVPVAAPVRVRAAVRIAGASTTALQIPVPEAPPVEAGPAPVAAPVEPAKPAKKPNFGLGLLGALLGSAVGGLIYYLLFRYTGLRFKLFAIGVGYLAGLGAELVGRKEGSKELGMIAATLAISAVLGAQYFVARAWWNEEIGALSNLAGKVTYQVRYAEAQKVVKAIPTGSDEEIRNYLAKENSGPDEKADPKAVTDEEVKIFRTQLLPEHQGLASGQITREEYEKKLTPQTADEKKQKDSEEGTFQTVFMLLVLSRVNLFAMAAAAGLAYRVCANA